MSLHPWESCSCGGGCGLDDRAHFGGPTYRERLAHIEKWEEGFRRTEMWKKKWDWRCPECGGQMMNLGAGYKNASHDFLLQCLVCQNRFVSGDYSIMRADVSDPAYVAYLEDRAELHNRGYYEVETQFVSKRLEPVPDDLDRGYVIVKDKIAGEELFEISWWVLHELELHTGSLKHHAPGNEQYQALIRKTFDAIELNKTYNLLAHVQKKKEETWWQRHWPWAYHEPYMRPYISGIGGLILEENLVGKDYRVNPRGP